MIALLTILHLTVVADTTYYDLLDLSPQATDAEIKRAYKKKAMQHHPDKNPDDPAAHETFQRIGQAYETLSNPDDRSSYDQYGIDGPPRGGMGGGGDMDDLFEAMFGGMGMGGASFSFDPSSGSGRRPKPSRGRDTIVPYDITLEEAYMGKKIIMNIQRDRLCTLCKGSGAKSDVKLGSCGKCEGKGHIFQDRHLGPGLLGKAKVPCPECEGEGVRLREKDKCKKCKGTKVGKEKKRVEIDIQPGTVDGERIGLRGEGDEAPDIPPGDVIFLIRHLPHSSFKPHPSHPAGSGLSILLNLKLSEALLGFSRILFIHLDGRGIRVTSKKGERVIQHGSTWTIKGEGMPVRGTNNRGDIYIRFNVEMPSDQWAKSQDRGEGDDDTLVRLPEKMPDLFPKPEVVVERQLSLKPVGI